MNNNIGEFIKEIRLEKKLKQRELGKLVGVDDKTISKWERGVYLPDITLLSPLSKALGLTVDELLNCKRHEPPQIEIKEEPKPKNKFTTKTKLLFIIIITIVSISSISATIFTNYIRKNKYPDDQIATTDSNIYKITSDDEDLIIEGYVVEKEDGYHLIIKRLCFKNLDMKEFEKTSKIFIYFQNEEIVLLEGTIKENIMIEGNSISIYNIETKRINNLLNKKHNDLILSLKDQNNYETSKYKYQVKIAKSF